MTCARLAPTASARSRTSSSSLPCPRSIVTAMISASKRSDSHGMATDVSRPPEYARTIFSDISTPSAGLHPVYEPFFGVFGGATPAADHENRVVAGDGAGHFLQPRPVDRDAQRLCLAGVGAKDQHLIDALDAAQQHRDLAPQRIGR